MGKENVLVFSGATYPAMQIIDCLKNHPRYHVVAAASYPNHSEFVCQDTVIDLPFVFKEEFMASFLKLIKEKDISYVIPTDETIAMILKEHEKEIPAVIVCSPYETTKLCRYKEQTYAALKGEDFTPITYRIDEIDSIVDYPVFVKPNTGQGSQGAKLIKSKEDFQLLKNMEDMVICEYLPGEEYTVDCFTNRNGKLIFCNPRVRTRLMNGITARGNNIPCTDEFIEVIEGLNNKIEFRGYWYTQLRRDKNGKLKLLEICTRFAGSFAISKGKGVNLPLLALCDFSGRDAEVIENDYIVECDKTYIDRYRLDLKYEHVYVDYDDTITANQGESVNTYMIAYLYQCKARKKKISLITRHYDTFKETLTDSFRKLCISESLFDEIIELNWNERKEDYIKNKKNSIFIDNSFAERKKVHEICKIPVFDVINVDCLFDWRL